MHLFFLILPIVIVQHEGNEPLQKSWLEESRRSGFEVAFAENLEETINNLSATHPDSPLFLTGTGPLEVPLKHIRSVVSLSPHRNLFWLLREKVDPFRVVSVRTKTLRWTAYGPNAEGKQVTFVETNQRPETLTQEIWNLFKANLKS